MTTQRPAQLARRLFGSVRREAPSEDLRARILTLGRAELERAQGGTASDAPRSMQRSLEAGSRRAATRKPERVTRGRRWAALGALAAALAMLVYLSAEWAPERGVMISAEGTQHLPAAPRAPAAPPASAPVMPAGDEAPPGPPRPPATLHDGGAPSKTKRRSPDGVRPTPPSTQLVPKKSEASAPPPAGPPRASLGQQLEQIKRARAALRAGDHQRALELLDAYRALPTGGDLGAEASLLRIEALALSGQRDAAAREARQFASNYPNSPLIDRALSFTDGAD